MTGFFCACIGELITGKGALGQLQLETRLPQSVINWGVFAIVVSPFFWAAFPMLWCLTFRVLRHSQFMICCEVL